MMASKREQVLSALFEQAQRVPGAAVKRNEALPLAVPAGGLGSMQCGDAGLEGGLDALRQALVAALSGRAQSPTADALQAELADAGFAATLATLGDDPALRLRRTLATKPSDDDVRARCAEALAVIGRSRLRDELKHTRATDATAEDWAARLSLIEASLGPGDE